jgi:hypothetical protein
MRTRRISESLNEPLGVRDSKSRFPLSNNGTPGSVFCCPNCLNAPPLPFMLLSKRRLKRRTPKKPHLSRFSAKARVFLRVYKKPSDPAGSLNPSTNHDPGNGLDFQVAFPDFDVHSKDSDAHSNHSSAHSNRSAAHSKRSDANSTESAPRAKSSDAHSKECALPSKPPDVHSKDPDAPRKRSSAPARHPSGVATSFPASLGHVVPFSIC